MSLKVPRRELWTPPKAKVNVHNHFLAELFDAKTGKKKFEAEAENVVLNQCRVSLAQSGGMSSTGVSHFGSCGLGIGSAAPAPTDTALQITRSWAGTAQTSQIATPVSASSTTGDWWIRRKFYFTELVANFPLTEVGLAVGSNSSGAFAIGPGQNVNTNSSASQLNTRALFKDANGDPITVTKDSSQVLVITATVYIIRGGVDENMRLLDRFFSWQVSGATNHLSARFDLGNGSTLSDTATTLSGTQQASKSGGNYNQIFWDNSTSQWFFPVQGSRPAGKTMVTSMFCDWETNEGNVTFSEVLINDSGSSGTVPIILLAFPCGTVTGTSFTKTNAVKLRQYAELYW